MKTNTNTRTECQYLGSAITRCGCPTLEAKSYCAEHYNIVYKAGTARARRHKEVRTVDRVRLVEQLMNEAIAELEAEGFDCYGERELDLDRV